MSPIYPRLRQAGAVFGQVMGYERPSWFEPPGEVGSTSSQGEIFCFVLTVYINPLINLNYLYIKS